ncbi:MAG: hypothetical protein IKI40_09070, partial [Treponema sp.]|nr:hypothetical protein [Treponema sp.]
ACRLTDAKIVIRLCEASKVVFEVILDEMSEVIECDKDARYKSLGRVFVVCQGNNKGYLDDYLTEQPLIFKSTKDDTIKGTEWIEGDNDESIFDNDIVEGIDWQLYNTDLSLEFRKDSKDQRVSIQDALYEILKSRDCKYILYDHSKGEIADYITFTERNAELIVELYHVKKMSATTYNNSVDDLYEVIGQAMKSVMWFKTKGTLIAKMKERYKGGNCMVKIGGDFQMVLNEINKTDKVLRGSICVVQPGIKKNLEIPEKLQEILAAADTYIKRAGKVNRFRILGSK